MRLIKSFATQVAKLSHIAGTKSPVLEKVRHFSILSELFGRFGISPNDQLPRGWRAAPNHPPFPQKISLASISFPSKFHINLFSFLFPLFSFLIPKKIRV